MKLTAQILVVISILTTVLSVVGIGVEISLGRVELILPYIVGLFLSLAFLRIFSRELANL